MWLGRVGFGFVALRFEQALSCHADTLNLKFTGKVVILLLCTSVNRQLGGRALDS